MKKLLAIAWIILSLFTLSECDSLLREGPDQYMYKDQLGYYYAIYHAAEEYETYGDIFAFQWDWAYVQTDPEQEVEDLNKALGFESGLHKMDVFWGYPMRIVFVYKNEVIYDYLYDTSYLSFEHVGNRIYPDDEIVVEKKKKHASVCLAAAKRMTILKSESSFQDFVVENDVVKLSCDIMIENSTSSDKTVSILANFEEDKENGLLKEAKIVGVDPETNNDYFVIPAYQSKRCRVVFIGTFGGNDQKQNRLLPELKVIERSAQ